MGVLSIVMAFRRAPSLLKASGRSFHASSVVNTKVCVVGGGGGIGQPLAMLLSMNPQVSHVSVFVLIGAPGVAADLSHINSPAKVTGHGMNLTQFKGDGDGNGKIEDQDAYQAKAFDEALTGCDVVVIPAGVPRKPGMTSQDLFAVNATLNMNFANAVAKNCPNAMVAIISNPVNSTVPIFAEQMKKLGKYDAKKIFGVTTLDIVRANTFVSEAAGIDVQGFNVPVIGGHAGASILPLLSRSTPESKSKLSQEQVEALTDRIQNGGTEVVLAKAGAGSATLSMAKAGADFALALVRAKQGKTGEVVCTYVESDVAPGCQWFSTECVLGPDGIVENLGIGELDEYETQKLAEAIEELKPSIKEGVEFVANN